ncbi:MAG: ribonuclease III [Faecalibacterium sp.]|nr:ribonuclease III [Ruminococcus sp.]MCM1391590.1 ribonuclease III [Ruminococcus sp.]MCM1486698.1 ribonuclease III [Faecalibacterium sp.]
MILFEEFEKIIGYTFKNKSLLETAFTHSSYANEKQLGRDCNERLEFLGDSVLGVVSADYFYHLSHLPEGEMTKRRAACVCEKSLYGFAKEIDLGKYILLGKGEEHTGGRNRPSILADAFEAVIAAIYLDGGLEKAREFILKFIKKAATNQPSFNDYKTALQEIIQKNPDEHLTYVLVGESGPDHNKRFEFEVRLNSNVIGSGIGISKKSAEQAAAQKALELMGVKL